MKTENQSRDEHQANHQSPIDNRTRTIDQASAFSLLLFKSCSDTPSSLISPYHEHTDTKTHLTISVENGDPRKVIGQNLLPFIHRHTTRMAFGPIETQFKQN